MKTRKVLAINHVFEILSLVGNGMNWKDAFLKVLPIRKGATEKFKMHANVDNIVETNSQS